MVKRKVAPNSTQKKSGNQLASSSRTKPEAKNGNGNQKLPKKSADVSERGSSGKYLFFIGLSVVVATAAVILTNEDVQIFLVKLTKMGSDPIGTILESEDFKQTTPADTKQALKTEKGEQVQQEHIPEDSRTTQVNPKDTDRETRSSNTEENKKQQEANGGVKVENKLREDSKPTDEKKKVKRKDYEKFDITSKGDYKIRSKLDAADTLLEQGDIDGAVQKFDKILQKYPDSPRALWGKGLSTDKLAEQKRSNQLLEEAINLMDRALRLSDIPEKLLLQVATKLASRQAFRGWSHKEAKTWKYLIEKYPDRLEYRRKLGVSYLMLGKIEEARNTFKEILSRAPDDGFALVHLGFIVKTSDLKYTDAIPMMQKGIDSNDEGTKDGRFFYHLGDAYMRTNQTDKARDVYKKGAELGLFLSADQRSLYNAHARLTSRPWWTPEQTTYQRYLTMLENNWEDIRDEGLAQLDKKTGAFIPEEENLRETGDWKQFTLYQRGMKDEKNCQRAPKTCALIDQIPEAKGCTRGQVKFSVMHPGVHVWPHTGPTNCRLRAHLGLKIPEGPRIRVGNDTRTWKEGKFIIIDDSFEHEVWHDGTELRLILIVDFWHPDIPLHERRTLSPI